MKVINMEWGNFRSSHLPLTKFDESLDTDSLNPGEQVFLKMAVEAEFFGETVPSKLEKPFILRNPDMSAMHHDSTADLRVVATKMKDILSGAYLCLSVILYGDHLYGLSADIKHLKMRKVIVMLCEIVATPGACLSAAGILGILKKIGRDAIKEREEDQKSIIAMDGRLFEHYSKFRAAMQCAMDELLGETSKNIIVELSNDGSGLGASLLAALHSQYREYPEST